MKDTKEFLTRGPEPETTRHPLIGIRFVSVSGSFEFIGDIVDIVDSVAIIKDPVLLGRDISSTTKFNFILFNKANPIVKNEIQVPLSAIAFLCHPSDQFIKNYLAAKSGLVTAATLHGNDSGDGRSPLREK
jgi:hypothetical protein